MTTNLSASTQETTSTLFVCCVMYYDDHTTTLPTRICMTGASATPRWPRAAMNSSISCELDFNFILNCRKVLYVNKKTSMPECPPARLTKVSARISVVAVQPRQAYEFPPLAICKWVLGVRSMLTRMTRLDPHCDDAKDYNPNGRHHARCRNVAFFIHCGQSNTHQCFACEPTMSITHALVTLLPPSETPCFQLRLLN
jgi:hypothetical protein